MTTIPRSRYFVFLMLAAGGGLVDLLTKHWIFAWLGLPGQKPTFWLIPKVFGFTTSLNEGALFGIGQGQAAVFAALSVAAGIAILYWLFVLRAARDLLLTFAMGCVMAGILGNLYDRLGLPALKWQGHPFDTHQRGDAVYAVRDWLHFQIDPVGFHWPIFNIADSLLVCGAALLVWHAWHSESQPREQETAMTTGDRVPETTR